MLYTTCRDFPSFQLFESADMGLTKIGTKRRLGTYIEIAQIPGKGDIYMILWSAVKHSQIDELTIDYA